MSYIVDVTSSTQSYNVSVNVETDKYIVDVKVGDSVESKFWAEQAQDYADQALVSSLEAGSFASNALNSANAAAASELSASQSATTATTKANEASASASDALASQNSASASASTATTQAGIATTQAGIATAQAGIATTQANNAAASASQALTSRNQAEGFKNDSQAILSDIQALLPNFPRPAVFALNKRAIQDSAIFGQKLKPTNDFLKAFDNLNPSMVMVPSAQRAGQLYSVLPEGGAGDFTVSRNGSATYLGSDGLLKTAQANEPRLEFNADGSFRGVLVEPAATNLLLRSEEFENSYWFKNGVTVESSLVLSPSGSTSRLIRLTNENTEHLLNVFTGNNNTFSFSFFAKFGNAIEIIEIVNSAYSHTYSLITGQRLSFGNNQSGLTSKITQYSNGWWRIEGTATRVTNNTTTIRFRDNSGNFVFAGSADYFVYLWGAQLEVGSVATSYIPTVASTVTRPADVITRTNAQVLIGQTEGSLYAESFINGLSQFFTVIFSIQNGGSMILGFGFRGNRAQRVIRDSLNFTTEQFGPTFQNNQLIKMCITYVGTTIKFFVNGSLVDTIVNRNPFQLGLNLITVSGDGVFSRQNNNQLKSAALFKTQLSDAQAIALTTL